MKKEVKVRDAFNYVLVVKSPDTGRIFRACFVQVEADVYTLFKIIDGHSFRTSRNRLLDIKFKGGDKTPDYIWVQYDEPVASE